MLMENSKITFRSDTNQNIHITLLQKISQEQLSTTVEQFLIKQQKALWIHLDQTNLNHIQMLILKYKFKIHYGLDTKVSLYIWLIPQPDLVPPYSIFQVGCGAIIIKDNHILLVEEKTGSRKGQFGIPGGRADLGQSIPSCSQRQLFQQTRIKAKFRYILYFRESSNTIYDGSDIYFSCMMQVTQQALQEIQICQRQLASYKWVHLQQYVDFIKTKSKGTQAYLAEYIYSLYKRGFDFHKRQPNMIKQSLHESKRDNRAYKFIQHFLIQQNLQIIQDQPKQQK